MDKTLRQYIRTNYVRITYTYYMKEECSLIACQFLWLMRPLQAAAASGGFSSLVVSLAREVLRSDYPTFAPEVCIPPLLEAGGLASCLVWHWGLSSTRSSSSVKLGSVLCSEELATVVLLSGFLNEF